MYPPMDHSELTTMVICLAFKHGGGRGERRRRKKDCYTCTLKNSTQVASV